MLRKCLVVVTTIITAMGMAGCGAKGPASVAVLPHDPVRMPIEMPALQVAEIQCPAEPGATDPSTTPLIWMAPGNWPNLDAVVTTFEEQYPQIHVDVVTVDPADYFTTSRQILATGCLTPDLLNEVPGRVRRAPEEGHEGDQRAGRHHPVHRRDPQPGGRGRGRRRHRRGLHPQAGSGPGRAADHRRHHARRVPQAPEPRTRRSSAASSRSW